MHMQDYEFWFVVGSQFLYGPRGTGNGGQTCREMTEVLNASGNLPCKIVYKVTAKTNKEIADVVREANYDPRCAGHHHLVPHLQPQQDVDQRLCGPAEALLPLCHPV